MPDLSILIVNTQSRDLLLLGLDAVQRELELSPLSAEVIVLDNASSDGSADAADAHPLALDVIARMRRQGKADSDSDLLDIAEGKYGLLLNEDAELQPGSLRALVAALEADPHAAAVGARLVRPDGAPQPSAWQFPSVRGALWSLIGQPDRVVQSVGTSVREVDWAQSAALLVRISASRAIGNFDRNFFVYSDEVDFAKRLRAAGHRILWSPDATVIHHEQLSTDLESGARRIVEFHRGRDRYLRKHHSDAGRRAITAITAVTYLARAVAALVLPGHDAKRYVAHARAAIAPWRGEGLREAAERFNSRLN